MSRRRVISRVDPKDVGLGDAMDLTNSTLLNHLTPEAQAPVVQTLDSAIHWITQLVLLVFIRWIVIYPVDSAIHRLKNWGQELLVEAKKRNWYTT